MARRETAALASYSKISQRSQRACIRVWTCAPSAAETPSLLARRDARRSHVQTQPQGLVYAE